MADGSGVIKMTKYFKHISRKHFITGEFLPNGEKRLRWYQTEGKFDSIPEDPNNMDYARMMEAVEAGEAEIEEVDDTPVLTYADNRRMAYASWGDQLDMQYHDAVNDTTTWKDHVAAVKEEHPKPKELK
jgi:hypothetical protein